VVVVLCVVLSVDDELVTSVVFDVDGIVVVDGAGQVVEVHMESNQSPLLNCEYRRTFLPFDK
jgi:5,10-methenyltetrahydromethanopterin hydrogenase